jgi:RNA polymerase sigma-70 factor, ECF subfamily
MNTMTNGDKAKKELFQKEMVPHMPVLFNFALRTTGNSDDAKDLLQDTYLKAYRFLDKYERGTNAKAWLFRIMKNSFINDYRKESRTPDQVDYDEIEDFYDLVRERSNDSNDLRTQMFKNLLADDVVKAMESLTEDFRTIIILSDLEGLPYEEIAEILEIPLGTVRSRLHRARKAMQEKLRGFAIREGYIADPRRAHRKPTTRHADRTATAFNNHKKYEHPEKPALLSAA